MSLGSDRRQNIQGEMDFASANGGEVRRTGGKETETLQTAQETENPASKDRWMEEICEWKNLKEAIGQVKANKGSAGVDGMTVDQLPDYQQMLVIREQLRRGTYEPKPVRRVEIAKPDGGVRKLGIREITTRAKGVSLNKTMATLAPYMRGWVSYFGFCQTPSVLIGLTGWIRSRLRAAVWRQWKTQRRRRAELQRLGVRAKLATTTAVSSRGPWHLARSQALCIGLSNEYFRSRGLPSLFERC